MGPDDGLWLFGFFVFWACILFCFCLVGLVWVVGNLFAQKGVKPTRTGNLPAVTHKALGQSMKRRCVRTLVNIPKGLQHPEKKKNNPSQKKNNFHPRVCQNAPNTPKKTEKRAIPQKDSCTRSRSLQRPSARIEVGVHIADVGHFLKLGSVTDQEAQRRSTSVYLIGRVLPMWPWGNIWNVFLCGFLCLVFLLCWVLCRFKSLLWVGDGWIVFLVFFCVCVWLSLTRPRCVNE